MQRSLRSVAQRDSTAGISLVLALGWKRLWARTWERSMAASRRKWGFQSHNHKHKQTNWTFPANSMSLKENSPELRHLCSKSSVSLVLSTLVRDWCTRLTSARPLFKRHLLVDTILNPLISNRSSLAPASLWCFIFLQSSYHYLAFYHLFAHFSIVFLLPTVTMSCCWD